MGNSCSLVSCYPELNQPHVIQISFKSCCFSHTILFVSKYSEMSFKQKQVVIFECNRPRPLQSPLFPFGSPCRGRARMNCSILCTHLPSVPPTEWAAAAGCIVSVNLPRQPSTPFPLHRLVPLGHAPKLGSLSREASSRVISFVCLSFAVPHGGNSVLRSFTS